jgi:hypothetical protein
LTHENIRGFISKWSHSGLLWIFIIGLLLAFGIGFAVGFAITTAYQKNTTVLIISAGIAAMFFGLAKVAGFLGFMRELYKDVQQRKKIPSADYGGVFKGEVEFIRGSEIIKEKTFYLQISKISGERTVRNVNGDLEAREVGIRRAHLAWDDDNNPNTLNITIIPEYLQLFRISDDRKEIKFITYDPNPENLHLVLVPKPYDECIKEKLIIHIASEFGQVPFEPFVKKVQEIIDDAKER